MSPMSRREFLVASAGLAVTAACGGGGDGDDGGATATVSETTVAGRKKAFELVVASYMHITGIDERLTVALLNGEGTGPLALNDPVQLTLGGQPVEAEVHQDGIPLPYLLVHHTFTEPGVVKIEATFKGEKSSAEFNVVDPRGVKVPYPGAPMISTPSPTPANTLGVDPICTADPACPLHDVSLDAALGERKPLAVLFSTPARCQSRLCGPVLDNLLGQREAFAGKVRFVHVEIYKARTGNELSPTVDAYGILQEPILFLAGADGVVRERLDNAFDRKEIADALTRLTS